MRAGDEAYCWAMPRTPRFSARTWIIGGFALVAAGTLVNLINLATESYFSQSNVQGDFELVLSPLAALAALGAWWFLSQIDRGTTRQASLLRRAFVGLGLQNLFLFATYVNLLWSSSGLDRFTSSLYLQTAGMGASAIGLLLMARECSPRPAGEAA
jgi:hypothetical protein